MLYPIIAIIAAASVVISLILLAGLLRMATLNDMETDTIAAHAEKERE